jgi:hypothetical protein
VAGPACRLDCGHRHAHTQTLAGDLAGREFVVECVHLKAHDRDDLFRRHQVGPESDVRGEPVEQRV